jgi:hypothetical protein
MSTTSCSDPACGSGFRVPPGETPPPRRSAMARRPLSAAFLLLVLVAGCSGSGKAAAGKTPDPSRSASVSPIPAPTPTSHQAADAALILTMYADIDQAFQLKPDDGIRALIASQYPGDSADVDFARCINAIVPGAKTLPASKRLTISPNIATLSEDPGYTINSDRVKNLHPRGRIYSTVITITDGGRPTTRERHQVVLDGKAYQFSAC